MPGENRTLTVITSELLTFRMSAVTWEPVPPSASTGGGTPARGVIVYRAEPGNETPNVIVAQFTDVHAIYWDDEARLVTDEKD